MKNKLTVIKVQGSFDEKIFGKSGILIIDTERISFNGVRNPTPQEYKKGVRKVLLNVKRNI